MTNSQGETINDIHNYLTSFNPVSSKNIAQVYIDESGQYFYQTVNNQMVLMEATEKSNNHGTLNIKSIKSTNKSEADGSYAEEEAEVTVSPHVAVPNPEHLHSLASIHQATPNNSAILNSGDNNQIVTVVPSTANGEVSYVFIVEQGSTNNKDDTVYDFNEVDDGLPYVSKDSSNEDRKMARVLARKSQIINPVHMCNYCNYTSPKRYLLSRHMRSHSEERPHKCSVCERGFKTLASLQNHVNTHTGIKPHRCKLCKSTFTTSGELVRHVRYIHTHEKPHKCPDCDYASVELSKLKRHRRCHTGERPYQCPHCTYASPDTFKLKRHLRIHTGEKPYECDICNARFTQSNSLKAHKLIHTGDKPIYSCEFCPTTCGRKTDLRIHVQKLHTSDKPLKCKKCGKTLPDRYTFKQHNKTHDGEKCFKCDLCSYASSSERHLESHMLIHTERKPFACDDCHQTFRQKQLLRRHQNLYHNPLYIPPIPKEKNQECNQCGKTFRHRGNLIRHMVHHSTETAINAPHFRVGRDKRFQIVNGEEVEVYPSDEDEVVTVEGQDGNQYVVLEVIQLQDAEGVIMSDIPETSLDSPTPTGVLSPPLLDSDHISETRLGSDDLLQLTTDKKTLKIEGISTNSKKETLKEVESCFGFNDEEDPAQMNLQFGD